MSKIVLLYPPFSSIECSALGNCLKTSGIVEEKKEYKFEVCIGLALDRSAV